MFFLLVGGFWGCVVWWGCLWWFFPVCWIFFFCGFAVFFFFFLGGDFWDLAPPLLLAWWTGFGILVGSSFLLNFGPPVTPLSYSASSRHGYSGLNEYRFSLHRMGLLFRASSLFSPASGKARCRVQP